MNEKSISLLNQVLKSSLDSICPRHLITKYVKLTSQNQETDLLQIPSHLSYYNKQVVQTNQAFSQYKLNKNVYACAFGKASLPMISQFESILGKHLVKSIAILPHTEVVPKSDQYIFLQHDEIKPKTENTKITEFYYGAKNNLPDRKSVV